MPIYTITEDISNVVHIGAGYCTESDLYQQLGINSVVFVEPDIQLYESASQKFLRTPHVNVLRKAIAGKSEERVYFQLNNKRFSSLHEPNRITEFYPNLIVNEEVNLKTSTLESLCDEIQVPERVNSLLVLELRGEETNVLVQTPTRVLQNFKWIVVKSSEEALYGKASIGANEAIKDALKSAQFDAFCFGEDNPIFL